MAQLSEFDLKEIFKSVWGYTAPPFLFGLEDAVRKKINSSANEQSSEFQFGTGVGRREYNIRGTLFYTEGKNGSEVFLPMWLIKSSGEKMLLPNTVSSMTCKKTIVETPLVNRMGTVKELISIDDWEINVKGIIVSDDYDYPDQAVSNLHALFLINEPLGIDNARVSLIFVPDDESRARGAQDIETVVIRSIHFPELKGMKNVQPFEMNLVSDYNFSLYEK